jgi:molybdenum cofactor cytidylyltransferase
MLAAIILAAGDSTRMGTPKALLPDPDGRPFAARIVRTFAAANITDIVIVTGSQHAAIVDAIAADRASVTPAFVLNPQPSLGQVSSLWIGLDAAEKLAAPKPHGGEDGPGLEGVLVTPVDIPMVRPSTIRQVIETWQRTHAPVVRPAVGARHGHPVLFDRALFDALRHAPLTEGARAVVHASGDRVVNVPVDDEGCLVDVDTPADYEAILRKPGQA